MDFFTDPGCYLWQGQAQHKWEYRIWFWQDKYCSKHQTGLDQTRLESRMISSTLPPSLLLMLSIVLIESYKDRAANTMRSIFKYHTESLVTAIQKDQSRKRSELLCKEPRRKITVCLALDDIYLIHIPGIYPLPMQLQPRDLTKAQAKATRGRIGLTRFLIGILYKI